MRWEGFLAVTHTLADQVGTDQTGNTRVDVNDGAASEVKRTPLP